MKPLNCYAIKNPQGKMVVDSIRMSEKNCIEAFKLHYIDNWVWAIQNGYSCVPCTVSEVREEVNIEKEAADYAEKHAFRVPYDGSKKFYDETDLKASKEGFIAGYNYAIHSLNKE